MARRAFAWFVVSAAAIWPVAALPADLEPSRGAEPPAQAASVLPAPEAACLEWTDGCRVCQRPPAGEIACSNVAIACVQQAPRCTRKP